MPATAGRVRMPHNNRMSTSATLKTSEVWQKTIGHDPHAPPQDDVNDEMHKKQQDEATAAVFAAARAQTISTSVVADFSSQLFHGLKSKSAPTVEGEVREKIAKGSELLDEPMSSSEDEFVVARKERGNKKKSKKRKHKRDSSEEDVSTHEEESRNKSKKKKKHHRSKKKRKKKYYSSSDESSTERKQEKHRKRSKSSASKGHRVDKKKGPPFIPAETFEGSKPGYVFHKGPEGIGYYEDRH